MRWFSLVLLLTNVLAAQEPAEDKASDPQKPQPVFSDEFSEDTRSKYKIKGDPSWEPGKLILPAGASVERTINGGPWTKVELKTKPVALTKQQMQSELRVWFLMDGASNCYVRLRRELQDGKTVASVSLVDTGEQDGKPIEQRVRQVVAGEVEFDDIRVEYRQGVVRVSVSGDDTFAGYISNGVATVRGIRLSAGTATSRVESLAAATLKSREKEYTEAEKQQIAQAKAANNELIRLYRQGKFAEAAKVGERLLAIRKQVLGEQHPDYATSLNNLALLYSSMGDSTRAEPLYKQTLEIEKQVVGEQHPSYANSLNNLAFLYYRMGDYARAESLYKQTLEIQKQVLGEQHPSYAITLNNLADLYLNMGDYARAEPLYKQSRDIRKQVVGEQHPSYAGSLNNLAALYNGMGDYARAEPLYKQSRDIWKQVLGEQHADYATSLNNLAALYSSMGDYARAEPAYKQAITIRKQVLGEQHPSYAISLNNLALLYYRMDDYARAEPLFKQTLAIRKQVLGEQHPDYATSLSGLASLYHSMGDYVRAEPLDKQCRDIRKKVLGEQHPSYAITLNNLAELYRNMGDYARAEPLFKQASEIWKRVLGDQHPSYASSLHNLAALYYSMGDYARAEPLFKQASEIWKRVLGDQHPSYASSLHNLAALYYSMGDYARAEPLYTQAVGIQRSQLNRTAAVQSARQQNGSQNAKRFFLDNRLANALGGTTPDAVSFAPDLWKWKGAVTARQQAYRKVAGDPKLAPLFEELRSLTQQLSVASRKIPIPPPKSATEIKQRAFKQKREIWEQRFDTLTRKREDLETQIAAGSVEYRRIQEPLTAEMFQSLLPKGTMFVDFLEYRHPTPDPKKKGKTNYERRYLAVVVPSEGAVKLVGLGAADPIREAITEFRRPLTGKAPKSRKGKPAMNAASKLREMVWLPLLPHLDGIETVVISPDTALGTLPFGALPGKKPGSYLIEKYKFASLPLAGMLRSLFDENTKRPQPERGLLVLGDVNYNANSNSANTNSLLAQADTAAVSQLAGLTRAAPRSGADKWESLPGFQAELAVVRDQFADGSVSILRDNLATEAAFMQQAAKHSHLHLITHGYFADPKHEAIGTGLPGDDRQFVGTRRSAMAANKTINQFVPGLLSGIVLAGANNPPPTDDPNADGILTASEIEALDLNGVDLVVLSACETGLGKTAGGEGLTGLQRAFHIAGVRSCIATLWEVDDRATQEFMKRFYRNLWGKKMSKIDAFRDAQLYLLNNPVLADGTRLTRGAPGKTPKLDPNAKRRTSEKTDPYFWAAFQLSGDWR